MRIYVCVYKYLKLRIKRGNCFAHKYSSNRWWWSSWLRNRNCDCESRFEDHSDRTSTQELAEAAVENIEREIDMQIARWGMTQSEKKLVLANLDAGR